MNFKHNILAWKYRGKFKVYYAVRMKYQTGKEDTPYFIVTVWK